MPRLRLLRKNILDQFAGVALANQSRLYRLWLIAPWFGGERTSEDPLLHIIQATRARRCEVIAVTRRPESAWHARAVDYLRANTRCTLYYSSNLHTKLYIMECDGFRSAVFGSPNLTTRADRHNRELAVEVRSTAFSETDELAQLLNDLLVYAHDLRSDDGVELVPQT